MSLLATLFSTAIAATPKDAARGTDTLKSIAKSVIRYPIKAIAAFLVAPFWYYV